MSRPDVRARLAPDTLFEEPEPLPPPPRQRGWLSRPRVPSVYECSRSSFETSEPATDRTALPPRSGFRRCFASPMLSRGGARPGPWFSEALFTPGLVQATRRSSTSAILERPASTTSNRPNPAHRTPGRPGAQLFFAGGFAAFRKRCQLGGIGPGAAQLDITPSAWRPSKRSLACEGFAPTQIDPDTPCRGLVTLPAGVSPTVSGAR